MREIKFMVWDKVIKRWHTWDEIKTDMMDILWRFPCWYVPVQYTGFKDKKNKGQDIYHRYILKVEDGYCGDHLEKGGNFVVEWVDDGWALVDKDGEYLCSLINAIYNRGAKIIGNIYENPKLIK